MTMKGCFLAILLLFSLLCLLLFAGLLLGGFFLDVFYVRVPVEAPGPFGHGGTGSPVFLPLLGLVFGIVLLFLLLSGAIRASRSAVRRDLPERSRQIQSLEEMRAGIERMTRRVESLETILSARPGKQ